MNQEEFKFQITNIEIIEFSLYNSGIAIPEATPFRFDTNIKHNVNVREETIVVVSSFQIFQEDVKNAMGKAEISCKYHIEDIHQFVNQLGKFSMPIQLAATLNSISLSTCRGVMFSIFRGTPLHSVIFPVIDPLILTRTAQKK